MMPRVDHMMLTTSLKSRKNWIRNMSRLFGISASIITMSRLKRFRIRPTGVTSWKETGASRITLARSSWIFCAALMRAGTDRQLRRIMNKQYVSVTTAYNLMKWLVVEVH